MSLPRHVTLGAATTYTQVRRHELLAAEFPLLCRAAAETGSIATQNRGTLGGNIANASPAADSPPALIVYDAELGTRLRRGSRWIAYKDFHTGYKQSTLQPDELIRRIRLPRNMGALEAALPQSRNTPRPGHLEGLLRRCGPRGRRQDRRTCASLSAASPPRC